MSEDVNLKELRRIARSGMHPTYRPDPDVAREWALKFPATFLALTDFAPAEAQVAALTARLDEAFSVIADLSCSAPSEAAIDEGHNFIARSALSALSDGVGNRGEGSSSTGLPAHVADATATDAQSPAGGANTFEAGQPAPYFCPACQAVPRAGYCKLAGCPTAPETAR